MNPHFPCDLRALLLKNEHDGSSRATGGTTDRSGSAFPHAGHVHRHQRPVDPVLLRTAAREHHDCSDDPQSCSHACPAPRRNRSGVSAGWTTSGGLFGSSSQLRLPTKSSRLVVEAGKRPDHLIAIHLELAIPLGTLHNLSIHHLKGKRIAAHGSLNPYCPLRYCPLGRPDRESVDLHFPCDLRALLLKNEPDASAAIGPRESAFPHAGHIDGHERPVDPVLLLHTPAREHEGYRDGDPR